MQLQTILMLVLIIFSGCKDRNGQSIALAGESNSVNLYECKTRIMEPGDPTPVQNFRLQKLGEDHYQAVYSPNIDNNNFETLAENLSCKFQKILSCSFNRSKECKAALRSSEQWGQKAVVFSCENAEGQSFKNYLTPRIEINALGNPWRATMGVEIHGLNIPNQQQGVFVTEFDFDCTAT